jgi:hypothetical protein
VSATSARPAALEAFRDDLIPGDIALANRARDLAATLHAYRRTNPDVGADHRHLADALDQHARASLGTSLHVGAVGAAFRTVDNGTVIHGVTYAPQQALQRAVERYQTARLGQDGRIDLRGLLAPLSRRHWSRLVYGTEDCPIDLHGRYGGGGGVLGPDGRVYPLVIPELQVDGVAVHASGTSDPTRDPATLGGSDPGWWTVHLDEGVTRFQDQPSGLDQTLVTVGFLAGLDVAVPNWATPDQLEGVQVSAQGVPFVGVPTTPQDRPEIPSFGIDAEPRTVRIRVEGEIHDVDPDRLHEYPRRVRRQFEADFGPGRYVPPSHNRLPSQQSVSRATNGVDLLAGGLRGVQVASSMDDVNHASYQLRYEVHPDGRRRARLVMVSARQEGDAWALLPHGGYVDDGDLVRYPLHYDLPSATINDPDATPWILVNRPTLRTLPPELDGGS